MKIKEFFNKTILFSIAAACGFMISCSNSSDSDTQVIEPVFVAPVPLSFENATMKDSSASTANPVVETKLSVKYDPAAFINADNQKYNSEISKFLSVLSADIYDKTVVQLDSENVDAANNTKIYEKLGLKDCSFFEIPKVTRFAISHKEYFSGNKNYSLIFVTIQGTDGTYEQWTANFDVGSDTEDFTSKVTDNSLWKNRKNHRGFDIAAGYVKEKLDAYIATKIIFTSDAEKIVVFTGHSRGAAIANIVGADFEKKTSYKTMTYAFATPHVTTDIEYAESVKTVFNIINTDDVIPVLPLKAWGFTRNGQNIEFSIFDSYKTEWETYTSLNAYNSPKAQDAIAKGGVLLNVASSRENLYKINDEQKNSIKLSLAGIGDAETGKTFLQMNGLDKFFDYTISEDGSSFNGKICPAYVMQIIPVLVSRTTDGLNLVSSFFGTEHNAYYQFLKYFVHSSLTSSINNAHCSTTYVFYAGK